MIKRIKDNFINNIRESMTKRKLIMIITGAASFLIFLLLSITSLVMSNRLDTQQMAKRWSGDRKTAQVSCFLAEGTEFTPDQMMRFRSSIEKALKEASITNDNPNARLYADAYSARGEITISNQKTSLTAKAVGIGGDFFMFHPLKLLNGSYFTGNDLNQDYVIIDEDAAWQLFGSNDVTGMTLTIKGVPHIVTGVIKRDEGRLNDKAGNDKTIIYVSYDSLNKYGTNNGINTLEIVMPNPISNFALNAVKEGLGLEEDEYEAIENTKRFNIANLFEVMTAFGTRSMNSKSIIYPYWENIAKGYEDYLSLILIGRTITLLITIILIVIWIVYRYRHKKWNMHTIKEYLENKIEKSREKRRLKKDNK